MHFINENQEIQTQQQNQIHQQPLDEITSMYESIMEDLNTQLKIPKDVLDSFQIKDELNQDIWNDTQLKPEVKTKLVHTAKSFFRELKLPKEIKIKDILFVGSLANYNWSKFSDIDLHIVIDFQQFNDEDFVKKYFDAEKNFWNLQHDVKIIGFPVEIYIQDIKEKLNSSAIYSIPFDKWIDKPDKTNFKVDKALIKKKVQKIFNVIKHIRTYYDTKQFQKVVDKVQQIKDYIKAMRKAGLDNGGEYSTENLVFKVLRRTDFMELILNFKNKAYDELMSLNHVP